MNEKSHVSMERRVCLVCGATYETGSILLDRHLRASMQRQTTTGWGLCPEDQKLYDAGFVALVECDPERSGVPAPGARLKPEQVYRTGRIAHVRREVVEAAFNVPPMANQACVFVDTEVIDKVHALTKRMQH